MTPNFWGGFIFGFIVGGTIVPIIIGVLIFWAEIPFFRRLVDGADGDTEPRDNEAPEKKD